MLFRTKGASGRWLSALLAVHWAWSAVAYHAVFFTRINPAAWVFAALFLVQAVLLLWHGVLNRRLAFVVRPGRSWPLGWIMVAYSLLYPVLTIAQDPGTWGIPAFGVPCPTTIYTAGLLMLATPGRWELVVIPIAWSLIGGSAAILLDVRADYALPLAGAALALVTFRRTRGRAYAHSMTHRPPHTVSG